MKFIVEFTCRILYSHNGALFSPPTPLTFIWSSYTLLNVFWDSLQCFLLCLSVIISWHPHTRNWRNTVLGFFFAKFRCWDLKMLITVANYIKAGLLISWFFHWAILLWLTLKPCLTLLLDMLLHVCLATFDTKIIWSCQLKMFLGSENQ